jgi:hypothetical protein
MNALVSNLGVCDGVHWLGMMKNPRGSVPGIQFALREVPVLQEFSLCTTL